MHRGPQAHAVPSAIAGPLVHAPNAALLIDFDNVTMGIRSDLQTELRNLLSSDIIHGKVAVQRAYADWRRYPQYIVPLSEASIDLIFAPAYGSSKKNATDIRLAIDAIELVFTRPEIGTIILLSGDSDFSSLVIKLKEYGKYVIGVGIRESSSDLLVQNCDEYYSYNALAGLVKSGESEGAVKYDPWELVTESITRMVRNGDVMRSDRLKQVMQEIDGSFDEKNLGISKFSKFCHEAAQKGLLVVTKLENGQLEVAPPTGDDRNAPHAPAASSARTAPAPRAASTAPAPVAPAEGEEREPRSRRGRRGGRGRNRGERTEGPSTVTADGAIAAVVPDQPAIETPVTPVAGASTIFVTTPSELVMPAIPVEVVPRERGVRAPAASHRAPASPHDSSIGVSGIRLTRDEAFSLVRDAVAALVTGDEAAPSERVRQKAFALLGRDSESLSERNFA
ncbi:MAG TPA: NYN domain-containing protein, partial [Gemmatimonadaceae bacterium]